MIAIETEDLWFNRPVLSGEETVVASYPANHTQGKRAVGGKLFLTPRRLIFVPNRMDAVLGGKTWDAAVETVLTISRDRPHIHIMEIFSGALRSRLAVSTSSGAREFFVVNGLDRVIADLTGHIEARQEAIT